MRDNDILLEKPILKITPGDAFEILGMKANNDRSMIQMNYHYQIINMQNNDASKEDFAVHRVALEVLLRYIDNLKTSESNEIALNPDEEIDVSYLSEGIKYLAALQHLYVRILQAREREEAIRKEAFVVSYEEAEDNMTPFDVGYPDEKEAKQLLKKIEALHVKNENGDYAGIMAEAYYQMTTVGTRTPGKNDLTWYQWLYDFASKAVKADNGPEKDAEYLFVCGYYLSQSRNKDSIRQAIAYLSEAENRVKGTFRERDVYYYLAASYYDADDYKNAFNYAKRVAECAPDRLRVYGILGGTAYRQLTLTSNRMYAVWAVKAYSVFIHEGIDYRDRVWATEYLCKVFTRYRKWVQLDRVCGNADNTELSRFTYNYYKGIAMMNTSREKEAIKHFEAALKYSYDETLNCVGTIYANLSRCYEKINYEKAKEYMNEFQQTKFNDCFYAQRCRMHFFIRTKNFERAKACAGRTFEAEELVSLKRFRIELCQAVTDEERIQVIDRLRQFVPNIQKGEKQSEKRGYRINHGGRWDEKDACMIGDVYYFLLNDDNMAIRYYELAIQITEYHLEIAENYSNPKQKTSYAHYMLTRIYGEQGKTGLMKKHAEAFMDYIREYFSDDDSKTIEEQYVNALDDFPYYGKIIYTDHIYIKPFEEMGSQYCGDYNACKLARLYIAMGRVAEAEILAVQLARKYRKDIPALVYVLMGDLARVSGNTITAKQMYRRALDKNAWEGFEAVRYLF